MNYYGKTFRKIREEKGYTMKQVANGIASVSFISKFERGESDISLSYFMQFLDRLSITFEEFFYIHHHYQEIHLEGFFKEAHEAYLQQDLVKLNKLKKIEQQKWENSHFKPYLCNTVMLEIFERMIKNEPIDEESREINILHNYLFHVEVWGLYELNLYHNTLITMPTEMVVTLSQLAYEKSTRYQNLQSVRNLILSLLVNTLIYLIGPDNMTKSKAKNYQSECERFFEYIDKLSIPEHQLYEKVQLLSIKGVYKIKVLGEKEEGTAMIEKSMEILNTLCSTDTTNNIKKHLQLTLDYLDE